MRVPYSVVPWLGSNRKMNRSFRIKKTSMKTSIKLTSLILMWLSLNAAKLTAISPSSTQVL